MILNACQIYEFFLKRLERLHSQKEYIKYQNIKSNIIIEYIKKNKIILYGNKHIRILEVGTSYGGMTDSLRQLAEQAIAIEIDKNILKNVKNNDFSQYICCDALQMPVKDNVFDSIICISVIEHVKDIKKLLDEMHRTLKDNGFVIIGFPPWYSIYGGHMNIPFTSFLPSKMREHMKKCSFIKYYPTEPLTVKKVEKEIEQYFKIVDKNSFFLPKFMIINPIQEIEPFVLLICQKSNL